MCGLLKPGKEETRTGLKWRESFLWGKKTGLIGAGRGRARWMKTKTSRTTTQRGEEKHGTKTVGEKKGTTSSKGQLFTTTHKKQGQFELNSLSGKGKHSCAVQFYQTHFEQRGDRKAEKKEKNKKSP